MIFAIFLVLIGMVWLLSSLGLITASIGSVIWPLIIIAIGLSLLLKKKHRYFGPWCCSWHEHDDEDEEEKEKKK